MGKIDVYVSNKKAGMKLFAKKDTPLDKIKEYSDDQKYRAYGPFKFEEVVDASSLSKEIIESIDKNGYAVQSRDIKISESGSPTLPDFLK
ncbi:MAG TPA: hypothetical protein VIG40_01170 [Tissierellaceae bacterium]